MKDLSRKSVCASLTNRIILNLLEMGYTWDDITKKSTIHPEEVATAHNRIPATKHYHLLTLLHQGGGEKWFLKRKDFSEDFFFNNENILDMFSEHAPHFSLLCLNSQSLREAINNYIKYRDIIGNVDTINCTLDGNSVTLEYFYEFEESNYQFVSMINFIFISFIVNHYLDEKITFLVHSKSEKNNIFLNIFGYWGCNVEWAATKNAISFTTTHLDRPFSKFNDSLFYILKKMVDTDYARVTTTDNIKEKVEQAIRESINKSTDDVKSGTFLNEICSRLSMSKTTLSRRLKSMDTSYKVIEKQVKLEEAVRMLNNSSLSIGDISWKLGFAAQSAFNKFFVDSMNITPLKFRKGN